MEEGDGTGDPVAIGTSVGLAVGVGVGLAVGVGLVVACAVCPAAHRGRAADTETTSNKDNATACFKEMVAPPTYRQLLILKRT
ncbi:MAG: hypothetical protein ACXVI3_04475 [Halobacteriota archaeon]